MTLIEYLNTLIQDLKPSLNRNDTLKTYYVFAKEESILSGIQEVQTLIELYDISLSFKAHKSAADVLKRGDLICEIKGNESKIDSIMPIMVYLIGKMSGIASMVNLYHKSIPSLELLDLGYYTPLLESIEKQALLDGGVSHLYYETVETLDTNVNESRKAFKINDFQAYDSVQNSTIEAIILENMNNESLGQAILENHQNKRLIISGNILPSKLPFLDNLAIHYLYTPLWINASRILEVLVKIA